MRFIAMVYVLLQAEMRHQAEKDLRLVMEELKMEKRVGRLAAGPGGVLIFFLHILGDKFMKSVEGNEDADLLSVYHEKGWSYRRFIFQEIKLSCAMFSRHLTLPLHRSRRPRVSGLDSRQWPWNLRMRSAWRQNVPMEKPTRLRFSTRVSR
jgi:hypothetical protein